MKKSTLTFLGRDSGFGRENNSVYVKIDDKLVIIDFFLYKCLELLLFAL